MDAPTSTYLARLFVSLSDATRLRLLALLSDGPASVGYLADDLGASQPKVSRHLAYLRAAGLVSTERDGKHIYYRIRQPERVDIANLFAIVLEHMAGVNTVSGSMVSAELSQPINISALPNMSDHVSGEEGQPREMDIFLL